MQSILIIFKIRHGKRLIIILTIIDNKLGLKLRLLRVCQNKPFKRVKGTLPIKTKSMQSINHLKF